MVVAVHVYSDRETDFDWEIDLYDLIDCSIWLNVCILLYNPAKVKINK